MHSPEDRALSPESFADIVRSLFAEPSLHDTLQRIVELAVETIASCDYAGVSLVEGRAKVHTPVFTHEVVRRSDALQYRLREGPSLDSIWESEYLYLSDVAEGEQWPRYAKEASKLPIGSLLTFRLFTSRETLGALSLYARVPYAFRPQDRDVGVIFSAQAATALSSSRRVTNLSRALETRETIGQAQGILMERHQMTAEQAWEYLNSASQNLNVRLAELARTITITGEEPGQSSPEADRSGSER
ncbi:GAF and ANTAR domain-containing protein [Allosalinactinospora lopnorensis]|uniref:GAF and ANTAR domain-containing protein n=1 Tax=Allosalinactinospora lopnorensis TaxID=1352348 RepID=UPI000623C295|nr:GAF and ANTAR domain-containing protein [Allosalinactinospora lopnorensis]